VWQFAEQFGGPPDLVVKSTPYTMPALAQDAWWKPRSSKTGLTEPRWVRAIEIRPSTVPGRKITHHALARLQQNDNIARNCSRTIRTSPATACFMDMGGRQETAT
jgi:hypothetical protein